MYSEQASGNIEKEYTSMLLKDSFKLSIELVTCKLLSLPSYERNVTTLQTRIENFTSYVCRLRKRRPVNHRSDSVYFWSPHVVLSVVHFYNLCQAVRRAVAVNVQIRFAAFSAVFWSLLG